MYNRPNILGWFSIREWIQRVEFVYIIGLAKCVTLTRFALLNISKVLYCTLPGLNSDKQWRLL